jgi:hypothetical protein
MADKDASVLSLLLGTPMPFHEPLLSSAGVELSSVLVAPYKITWALVLYIGLWLMSVIWGIARKHENVVLCMVDSAGVPAILAYVMRIGGLGE